MLDEAIVQSLIRANYEELEKDYKELAELVDKSADSDKQEELRVKIMVGEAAGNAYLKRMPKKVVFFNDGNIPEDTEIIAAYCPSCGGYFERGRDDWKSECCSCHQVLDWSDVK